MVTLTASPIIVGVPGLALLISQGLGKFLKNAGVFQPRGEDKLKDLVLALHLKSG